MRLRGLAAAIAVLALAACAPSPYRFEAVPRAVVPASAGPSPRHARLAQDDVASGTVYLLAVAGRERAAKLTLSMSQDGGDTFAAPVDVSLPGQHADSHGEDAPALITRKGLYAAWDQGGDIRFARSTSFGSDFEPPVPIRDRPGDFFSGYVAAGTGADGGIDAVWIDTRDSAQPYDTYSIYTSHSSNQGRSFEPNVRVEKGVCACCRPGLAYGPKGELLVFYRGLYPGGVRDLSVAISRDHGRNFEAPKPVAREGWHVDGCPDSGVATARAGDRIYVAWLSEPDPKRSGIFLSWSDDAGATWAPAVVASQGVLDANYASLADDGEGHVVLAFQGRDPDGRAQWAAVAPWVVDIGEGARLSKPLRVPGASGPVTRPSVALGRGGRIYVCWTSELEGATVVMASRGRRA